jgi:hypothetical protein
MATYEVTVTLNDENLGTTTIEADTEDEAIEIAEADLDLTGLTLSLTGYLCIGDEEFEVNMEYTPRDIDIENNFGNPVFTAIELEA